MRLFHIVKNEYGLYELWKDGRIVGIYKTREEAERAA